MRVSQNKDRIDTLLTKGLADLSMTLAVLARIDNNNYEIVAVQSNSGAYVPGKNMNSIAAKHSNCSKLSR